MTHNARQKMSGSDNTYSDDERRVIADEALGYLDSAESALWIVDPDLAREAALLIDRVREERNKGLPTAEDVRGILG